MYFQANKILKNKRYRNAKYAYNIQLDMGSCYIAELN